LSAKKEEDNVTDFAYKYIKKDIVEGVYKPSEKLLEVQLSKNLNVSRNTIKKAFFLLQQDNLVDIERNKGAKVKSFSLQDVMNFLEIRSALEGIIIKSTVKNINEAVLIEMKHIIKQMEAHSKEGRLQEYSEMNKKFHNLIYKNSTNQEAVDMVATIKTQLIRFHFRTVLIPGRKEQSLKEHKLIFQSIKNQSPEEAAEHIQNHILNVSKTILDNYNFLI